MGRRIAGFWERVDAIDRRIARLGRGPELEERAWQSWWNLAGAPGFISDAVYGQIGLDEALACAPALACIDILSDAMGRTPVGVFRGAQTSTAVEVKPAPSIVSDPSGIVAPDVWRYQLGFSMVTDGNAFGQVTSTSGSWPATIELLDPATVKHRKVVNGQPQVEIDNKVRKLWPTGDIWHCPGRMVQPGAPWGLSPVAQSQKIVATALAAEQFALGFFEDGGHPTSIISSAKDLNAEQAQAIKNAWRRATSDARDVAIMGGDLKFQPVSVNPTDSQFIDTMRWCVEQISRVWRVPPAMIYGAVSGESITYANVSDADLAFLKHSLDGLYVRVETALTDILPRPQYAKYNRNAILRSDVTARFNVYETAIRNGLLNRNEIRDLEDLKPIPDTGDEYVWPPVGKGAGMDVRPPSTGGVVQENPQGADVAPAPVPPSNGSKPVTPAQV